MEVAEVVAEAVGVEREGGCMAAAAGQAEPAAHAVVPENGHRDSCCCSSALPPNTAVSAVVVAAAPAAPAASKGRSGSACPSRSRLDSELAHRCAEGVRSAGPGLLLRCCCCFSASWLVRSPLLALL